MQILAKKRKKMNFKDWQNVTFGLMGMDILSL